MNHCIHLHFFSLLLFNLSTSEASVDTAGDVKCKEALVTGNSSKVTVECRINLKAGSIPCLTGWDTLHLEIFGEQNTKEGTLNSSIFSDCGQLRVLAIWDGGPLSRLQRELFQPLHNLQRLVIRSTKLFLIGQNLLIFLPYLQLLSITDSKELTHLSDHVLQPLPSQLTTLDLSDNQLMEAPQPRNFGNHALRNLYLTNNKISRLYEDSLFGLSELKLLRLSGNQLSGSLEFALGMRSPKAKSALILSPKLEILDLANNRLSEISGCQWSGGCWENPILTRLRVLNLAKNRLTWLDPRAFDGLPALTELRLEGNSDLLQSGSLPVLLFTLTHSTHPRLKNLAIPHDDSSGNGIIEMCSTDSPAGSRIILSAIEHLDKNFCEKTKPLPFAFETMSSPAANVTRACSSLSASEHFIFTFIRRAHRWVLTGIAIGLLLTGVLVSAIICVCLHYGLRFTLPKELECAPSSIPLHHVDAPSRCYPDFMPLNRLSKEEKLMQPPTKSVAQLAKSQELSVLRNASNSIYSLLSAPQNATTALGVSCTATVNTMPGTKQAIACG